MKPKQCKLCGKTYEPTNKRQLYCLDCREQARKMHRAEYNAKRYKPKPREPKTTLDEKVRKAKAEGMSYGQYQAQKLMEYARVRI